MPVRVLIIDDHDVVRRGIRSILSGEPDLEIASEAADGADALRKVGAIQPDLILLDISLPDVNGIELAPQLLRASPQSQILFLSQHDSAQVANEALKTGASGFVAKSEAARELPAAIRRVRSGQSFVSERLTKNPQK